MAWACPPTSATKPRVGLDLLFSVYIALSIGGALCVLGRSMLVSLVGLLTAEKFFKNMLHCILRAPMSFFDSTPTGRILNRVGVQLLLTSFFTVSYPHTFKLIIDYCAL
jgi:ATP-binding cassette subfamily C (CFTR/MRP) protein 1